MMFPRTIKNSLTKKILSVSLIGCITVTITAAGMQPFLVYASVGSGTLRGIIIGASALLGTSNINPASINYLNNNAVLNSSIESVYDGSITAADIDAAISGDLGLARWAAPLSNNQQQVSLAQQYISAAGGDPSSLNGVGRASVGQNLKAYADYYYEHGELKPAFGGQTITDNLMGAAVMQSMADVAYNFDNAMWYARENGWTDEQIDALFDSGAAFGDLQSAIDYVKQLDDTVIKGKSVNTQANLLNYDLGGYSYFFGSSTGTHGYYLCPIGVVALEYGNHNINLYNITNSGKRCCQYYIVGRNPQDYNFTMYGNSSWGASDIRDDGTIKFNTSQERDAYLNALRNGRVQLNYDKESPDIITNNGQAKGTVTHDSNGNPIYNLNINPVINNNNYNDYNYILPDDTIIDTAIDNIQDAVEDKEQVEEQKKQKEVELQQAIINNSSQETINNIQETINNLEQTINNYEQTIINNYNYIIESMQTENVIPQPTEAPHPTVIPPQPTEAPKPTNTPEQEEQNQQAMATVDLADKFPFCIPFDIFDMMGHFTANRTAPCIIADIDFGPAGVQHIELDFSAWDSVAALLRLLELIVFIVGLALVARRLIGAGGD